MHYFAKGLLGLVILTPIVGYTMGYWWGFGVAIMCILAMTGMFERKKDMEKKNEDLAKRIAQNIGKNATKQNNSQLTEYPGQTRQMERSSNATGTGGQRTKRTSEPSRMT